MSDGGRPRLLARASVLDRLLDTHPDRSQDDPQSVSGALAAVRRSVHRDLEALLNARRSWWVLDGGRAPLRASPIGYGISDVTAGTLSSPRDCELVRTEIEQLIRRFEPRLAQVRVTLLPVQAPLSATLPLSIDALLLVDPEPEPIRFATVLSPLNADLILELVHED